MIVLRGIPRQHQAHAAALYWEAFGSKLAKAMGPAPKGRAYVTRVIDPDHAFCALDAQGQLVGIAGFKTHSGALVHGTLADMRAIYGLVGALWRSALLHLLARDTENRRFLVDGICVAPKARGQGVGTALINAIHDEALNRGYREVRLDVIDSNHRARALYEREGYRALKTERLGPLRFVFGFRAATTMVRPVLPHPNHDQFSCWN